MTRRRLELDCQIAFLQEGFRLKTAAPWPSARRSKRETYAIIVRRAAPGDLAALRLAGQHGEAVALGGGGEGDDGRLLLHPVQAREAVAGARLQGGLAALPTGIEDQNQ